MEKYVVGLGEALWDVLPDGKKLGGAPANFAFHSGQFGLNSIAVSALGEDKLAEETIAQLKQKRKNLQGMIYNRSQSCPLIHEEIPLLFSILLLYGSDRRFRQLI